MLERDKAVLAIAVLTLPCPLKPFFQAESEALHAPITTMADPAQLSDTNYGIMAATSWIRKRFTENKAHLFPRL